jgi:hypothetical protein
MRLSPSLYRSSLELSARYPLPRRQVRTKRLGSRRLCPDIGEFQKVKRER